MREWRKYSDEERAACLAALDANGGNVSKTAQQCGVPRKTLEEWVSGRVANGVAELRQAKRQDLADLFEDIAYKALALVGKKLDDLDGKALVTTAAIATDKMRLLRDQPTNNVKHRIDPRELSDDELLCALAEDQ